MCCSESWIRNRSSCNDKSVKKIVHSIDSNLNLTVHLSIAKKLLHEQSVLAQHLKYLTQEIKMTSFHLYGLV